MKKIFLSFMAVLLVCTLSACGSQTTATSSKESKGNVLVVYFSHSGTTREVAQQIQSLTGADIAEIQPVDAYSDDYDETVDRAQEELEEQARPEIQDLDVDLDSYDTIFLGYPIWWHDAPMVVYTFLENNDLNGKRILPFCTSGGSSIDESMSGIRSAAKDADVEEGYTANDLEDVENWVEGLDV